MILAAEPLRYGITLRAVTVAVAEHHVAEAHCGLDRTGKNASMNGGRGLCIHRLWSLAGTSIFIFGAVLTACGEEEHPTRQERLADRAIRLCQAKTPAGQRDSSSSPGTAGEIVRQAQVMKADPSPWDTVAKDHFVARCSYIATSAADLSHIKTCPDGQNYDLRLPTQIIVDEEERSSPDFAGIPGPVAPC